MVYRMVFNVDGGCRRNGQTSAIGAAAACFQLRYRNNYSVRTRRLPSYPTPTNQRAEIIAIIIALQWALERFEELDNNPYLDVKIYSDSRYAVNCLETWVYTWANNGWLNAKGREVANRDLIEEASDLDDKLRAEGDVEYIWVPRSQNADADRQVNDEMDDMENERESESENSYSSSDDSW